VGRAGQLHHDRQVAHTKSLLQMKIRYRLRTIIIALSLAAIVLALAIFLVRRADPFSGVAFDRAVWIRFRNNDDPDNPRAQMVSDLLRNHLHQGMSQSEVIELLGEPEEKPNRNHYEYVLGMWSGFRVDYDVLEVDFDSAGRVSLIRVVQH
jgi:hypothetical protein